jgi:hypothetical protein
VKPRRREGQAVADLDLRGVHLTKWGRKLITE